MIKLRYKLLILLFILAAGWGFFSALEVFAQADDLFWAGQQGEIQAGTGLGSEDPRIMAANIIRIILGFLGIVAVLLIMYGGWLWMSSNGNMEQVDKAKKVLISAVIGLVIIMASFGIATFILNRLFVATGAGGGGSGGGSPWSPSPSTSFNCDGNSLMNGCQADTTICDTRFGDGFYFCSDECRCERLGDVGDPCDSDETNAVCDPDDAFCMADLRCDTDTCLCVGAPVIRWISPEGGFCNDDINVSCRADTDCPSGTCNDNNPNGAPGNFVTIGGSYFGDDPGRVYFWDGSGFNALASFPNSVNSNCTDNWQNDQIIVIVPAGARTGHVRVERADMMADTTDNARGPLVPEFIVNTITRPGLCDVNPAEGFFEDFFNLQGISFNGGSRGVFFGSRNSNIPAVVDLPSWTNTQVDASVPNISDGGNTVFVEVDSELSNSLRFNVLIDLTRLPIIEYISPEQGPPGQYVTIYGQNFENYRAGASLVEFTDPAGIAYFADGNDFPEECRNVWWQSTYIVVKVPPAIGSNYANYGVTVTNRYGLTSLPEDFPVVSGTPGPGICLLDPHNGPVNTAVATYGDNLGDSQGAGFERFYNNVNATAYSSWANQLVEANVPTGAQTGPVEVSNGAGVSNNLPFRVGFCTDDSQCNLAEECCGAGTYWAGYCRPQGTCIYTGLSMSGYGWSFSTGGSGVGEACFDAVTDIGNCDSSLLACAPGLVCDPNTCVCRDPALESCSGVSLVQCAATEICPNSPGECSVYPGGGEINSGACQYDCQGVGACTAASCTYNSTLDRCLTSTPCDLTMDTEDYFGNSVVASCKLYFGDNQGHWQFSTRTSCPIGWVQGGNNTCIDISSNCLLCSGGYACMNDGGADNYCGVATDMCPANAVCESTNECIANDSELCECCCEIGFSARDCCVPLECLGTCGDDNTDDGAGYGDCTGCDIPGASQAEKDQACNCFGTSGKYCDVSSPGGVCRDCAQLQTPENCSDHSSTCCVDGVKGDNCRGGSGDTGLDPMGMWAYCAYYQCEDTGDVCDVNPIALPTNRSFPDLSACQAGCVPGPQLGRDCNYLTPDINNCNESICPAPFGCIAYNGDSASPPAVSGDPASCGICCCDPNNDFCSAIEPSLVCQRDQDPCDGPERGLCCGCGLDLDCGDTSSVGCGSDTCCRPRPQIIDNFPSDEDEPVCRNTLISAEFDREMDIASFAGNVYVLGDYGSDPCPAGTNYLSGAIPVKPANIFVRSVRKIFNTLLRIAEPVLPHKFVQAYAPVGINNYCVVTGSSDGYLNAADHTVMTFSLSQALEANRLYYVLVKGDANLDSSSGVFDIWNVGMNGPNAESFNSVNYPHSYIWSFTTGADICLLEEVTVNPASFLFNRLDITQDFQAEPRAGNGQIIVSLPGVYAWAWNWYTENFAIATVVDANDPIRPVSPGNKKEGKTHVVANASITEDNISETSSVGNSTEGKADIWVFICENPWPPFNPDNSWAPWIDDGGNCNAGGGTCYDTNFSLYYCRDTGSPGTFDDLPALETSGLVIRQEGENLKEAYFPVSVPPGGTSNITVSPIAGGGSAIISWSAVLGVAGYNLYWGTKSGPPYGNHVEAGNMMTAYTLTGLTNNKNYYFNVTSYNADRAESDFYGEVVALIADTVAPAQPANLQAVGGDSAVSLNWDEVAGAENYRVYYTAEASLAAAGQYGAFYRQTSDSSVAVQNLLNGNYYYFGVTSLDQYGNESAFAQIQSIPFAGPSGLDAFAQGSDVDLVWNLNGDGVNQTVFWGEIFGSPNNSAVIVSTDKNYTVGGLAPGTTYYFRIETSNGTDAQTSETVSETINN